MEEHRQFLFHLQPYNSYDWFSELRTVSEKALTPFHLSAGRVYGCRHMQFVSSTFSWLDYHTLAGKLPRQSLQTCHSIESTQLYCQQPSFKWNLWSSMHIPHYFRSVRTTSE